MGFDFAFGLSTEMDSSYGSYIATEVVYYYVVNDTTGEYVKKKEKRPLDLVPCGTEYFNYTN